MNYKKIFIFGFFIFMFPSTASAYVDPGTGAYLLQLLITLFGAFVFYISKPKHLFLIIKDYLSKKIKNKNLK